MKVISMSPRKKPYFNFYNAINGNLPGIRYKILYQSAFLKLILKISIIIKYKDITMYINIIPQLSIYTISFKILIKRLSTTLFQYLLSL